METIEADVLEATRGDRGAWRRLVDRHRGLVTSVALARVRDVGASEVVAQEVFVLAWSNLKSLRNPASFAPWLRQMARFRAEHFTRARTRRAEVGDEDALAQVADPKATPEVSLVNAEEARLLAAALDRLSADDREVLLLFYREGRSVVQVAALLGISEAAAKKRLSRARAQVKEDVALVTERTAPGERFSVLALAALPEGNPGDVPSALALPRSPWLAGTATAALVVAAGVAVWLIAGGFTKQDQRVAPIVDDRAFAPDRVVSPVTKAPPGDPPRAPQPAEPIGPDRALPVQPRVMPLAPDASPAQ